eukprot:m51a1_g4918 hypothetical protein (304) ;mRNA; f:219827-221915
MRCFLALAAAARYDCMRVCPNERHLCRGPCEAAPGATCRVNHCSCSEVWTLPNGLRFNASCAVPDCERLCPNERQLCAGTCEAAPGAVCRVDHCACAEAAAARYDCMRVCPNERHLCRGPCEAAPGATCRVNHCSCSEVWTLPNGLRFNASCAVPDCERLCPNERQLCAGTCEAAPGAVCRVDHCACAEVWVNPSDNTRVAACSIPDCEKLCLNEQQLCAPSSTCPDAPLATCLRDHCRCSERWVQPTGRPAVCHRAECEMLCLNEDKMCRGECDAAPTATCRVNHCNCREEWALPDGTPAFC